MSNHAIIKSPVNTLPEIFLHVYVMCFSQMTNYKPLSTLVVTSIIIRVVEIFVLGM